MVTVLEPRSQNRDLGHPVLWRVRGRGVVRVWVPHLSILRGGFCELYWSDGSGGPSAVVPVLKPRSQKRDLGHPPLIVDHVLEINLCC